jgi:hypothetical protein
MDIMQSRDRQDCWSGTGLSLCRSSFDLQFKKKLSAARLKMPARGQLEIYCRQNTLTLSRGALPTTPTLPSAKRRHHHKCETVWCAGLVEFTVRMICLIRLCEMFEAQPHNLFCLMVRAQRGFIIELCEIIPSFCMFGGGQLNCLLLVGHAKRLLYFALTNACAIPLWYRDPEPKHL